MEESLHHFDAAVYLISLQEDEARRSTLKETFSQTYPDWHFIEAENGNKLTAYDYYLQAWNPPPSYQRVLTPTEIGCRASHIKAMRHFVDSGKRLALIIEDDVIGDDLALLKSLSVASSLDGEFMLSCGGQEGLPSNRWLMGKNVVGDFANPVYRVDPEFYRFLWRTCCNIYTREVAQQLLRRHETASFFVDDWHSLMAKTNYPIYLSYLLSHPADKANSRIEAQRGNIRDVVRAQRTWRQRARRILATIGRFLVSFMRGNSLIHKRG